MKKQFIKHYLASLFLVILVGNVSARTVATVGSTLIDSSEVDKQVNLIVKDSGGKIKRSKMLERDVLEKLITRHIAVSEARKQGLDKSRAYLDRVNEALAVAQAHEVADKPGFKEDFNFFKEVILTDVYAWHFLETHKVSESDIRAAYQKFRDFYQGSDQVKIGEIVTDSEKAAQKALTELKKGVAFSKMAAKFTVDPLGKRHSGVYNNYVNLKDLQAVSPQYYEAVRSLKKGEFTPKPLPNGKRYLIIGIVDRKPVTIPSYSKIKNSIRNSLVQQKLKQESQRLNQKYQVKIYR